MTERTSRQRTAIVTGAARGIGAAVAKRLARDGLAVGVIDRSEADCAATVEAITADGGSALAVAADVVDEDLVNDAVARVAAELGPPTVLVNNAGVGTPADLMEMTTEQWDALMGVNLRGPLFVTRAVCRHMMAARWGRIVNVSSISALGDAGRIGCSSAKAGLIGFTKSLALEFGPYGVTANAIAPGFVVSDMTAVSARRLGRRTSRTASFLVSPEAEFVSGQVIYGPVD